MNDYKPEVALSGGGGGGLELEALETMSSLESLKSLAASGDGPTSPDAVDTLSCSIAVGSEDLLMRPTMSLCSRNKHFSKHRLQFLRLQ